METRARDNSHTPYESAGMIESDQIRVMTPLGLWLVRSDSNYRAPLGNNVYGNKLISKWRWCHEATSEVPCRTQGLFQLVHKDRVAGVFAAHQAVLPDKYAPEAAALQICETMCFLVRKTREAVLARGGINHLPIGKAWAGYAWRDLHGRTLEGRERKTQGIHGF